jgi:YHS domain-containing protein
MLRLILIVVLIFIVYQLIKGFFGPKKQIRRKDDNKVIDEMVQDPVCKTYIPRRQAVKVILKGREYNFCSESCAEKFKAEQFKG